ncbi:hypothetical protein GCM10017687_05200 [Streptomyces echinatus]
MIPSAAAPEGTAVLAVPAGGWAVFTVSGPAPRAIQELWRDVFTQWFPSNPYRGRPGTGPSGSAPPGSRSATASSRCGTGARCRRRGRGRRSTGSAVGPADRGPA